MGVDQRPVRCDFGNATITLRIISQGERSYIVTAYFEDFFRVSRYGIGNQLFIYPSLASTKSFFWFSLTNSKFSVNFCSFLGFPSTKIIFSVLFMPYKINLLLIKLVRSRWLDIGLVLFLRRYGPRQSSSRGARSIKTQKENSANIQPS